MQVASGPIRVRYTLPPGSIAAPAVGVQISPAVTASESSTVPGPGPRLPCEMAHGAVSESGPTPHAQAAHRVTA